MNRDNIKKDHLVQASNNKFPKNNDVAVIIVVIFLVFSSLTSLVYAFMFKNMPIFLIIGCIALIIASIILYPILFWQYKRIVFDELYEELLVSFRIGRQEFMDRSLKATEQLANGYQLSLKKTENILREMLSSHPDFVYAYKGFIDEYRENKSARARFSSSVKAQTDFISEKIKEIADQKIDDIGVNERSYLLPISMTVGAVAYGVFILSIRFILSIESMTITVENGVIKLPLYSFEWAFIGAYLYVLVDIIKRFIRRDLIPRVFMQSAVRMIIGPFAAIAIVLMLSSFQSVNNFTSSETGDTGLLLVSLLTGTAPITTFQHVRKTILTRFNIFKKTKEFSGDRSASTLGGIDIDTERRLDEEDIHNVQTLATCNPKDIADRTKFHSSTIEDWRSQAILYLLTGNRPAIKKDPKENSVYDELRDSGIRTADDLLNGLEVNTVKTLSAINEPNMVQRKDITFNVEKAKELLTILDWEEKYLRYLGNLCLAVNELLKKGITPAGKI